MTLKTTRVAVLISGEGSNLQALIDAAGAGRLGAEIVAVVSNRSAARGLERARTAGIAALHLGAVRGQERAEYDAALAALLAPYAPELLVLAGFMRILGPAFIERFAGRMLNIHPSLLPKYPGLDTHRRVLEAQDQWHGATVHFVTQELDAGPAILQYRVRVRAGDTTESLAQRVHVGEHIILPRAVSWFAAGRLRLGAGSVMLDGRALQGPVSLEEGESQ
ncbi:MAG TPA: phosphoribosylglycinamide formyltransferase [Gammaproteobacteria bacterium]|nr:phosphoribosylglycinamide formyltransferase [Gammaproteobacteria bacterium]